MTHQFFRWPVLILSSFVVTLATVAVGNSAGGFGFPLPWKTGGCPPPGIVITSSCLLAIGFDWLGFSLDVLFYTAIGFAIILLLARYRPRSVPSFRRT